MRTIRLPIPLTGLVTFVFAATAGAATQTGAGFSINYATSPDLPTATVFDGGLGNASSVSWSGLTSTLAEAFRGSASQPVNAPPFQLTALDGYQIENLSLTFSGTVVLLGAANTAAGAYGQGGLFTFTPLSGSPITGTLNGLSGTTTLGVPSPSVALNSSWTFTYNAPSVPFAVASLIGGQTMLNVSAPGGYANSALASTDSVRLSFTVAAVPEPQEWAMMIAGLGLVGALARRRRAPRGQSLAG